MIHGLLAWVVQPSSSSPYATIYSIASFLHSLCIYPVLCIHIFLIYLTEEREGGIEPDVFAEHVWAELVRGAKEITYDSDHIVRFTSPEALQEAFKGLNE